MAEYLAERMVGMIVDLVTGCLVGMRVDMTVTSQVGLRVRCRVSLKDECLTEPKAGLSRAS